MTKFETLLSPLQINGMTLRNRVVMTAAGTNFTGPDGVVTEDHLNYYGLRAKGGTGLIIIENVSVDSPVGSNGTTQLRIDHERYVPGLYRLCERVHLYGGCIAAQLNHAGSNAKQFRTGVQPVSASNITAKIGGEEPRPLRADELPGIAEKYAQAAVNARKAGFDAVEIHGAHSYLISQFLSPLTNHRTDEFGGCAENRARFPAMVLAAVRKAVGPRYPVILRINGDEMMEGGNDQAAMLELLAYLAPYVDAIDVSAAVSNAVQYQIDVACLPDGWRSFMARAVREKFNKPVITVGNIRNPEVAENILEKGDADMIGMARGLIAEPDWVNKVASGRVDQLRKCISCNVGCVAHRVAQSTPIRCTINPDLFHDADAYKTRRVNRTCNVAVIGAGTAGLEAACTAAEVGCNVFVFEKEAQPGGLTARIARLPDKARFADFTRYQTARAQRLPNLYMFLGEEARPEKIRPFRPDLIVFATGAEPLLPPIENLREALGEEGTRLITALDALDRLDSYPADMRGMKVAVAGGGAVGIDMAEFFGARGAHVTVIEWLPQIGADLDPVYKSRFRELTGKYDIELLPGTRLTRADKDRFTALCGEEKREFPFDYGFACLGLKSKTDAVEALRSAFPGVPTLAVGDSRRARRIIEGVAEGRAILVELERMGFLPKRCE